MPPSTQSEAVLITVRRHRDWWEWVVTDTASSPPFRLGAGYAPDRASAWLDAAEVIADVVEAQRP